MTRFALALLAGFALLSLAVHLRQLVDFDFAALLALQDTLPRWVDLPFSILSLVGLAEVTGIVFLLIVWRAPQNYRLALVLMFGAMTLVEFIGKTFIHQPTVPDEFRRFIFDFHSPSSKMPLRFSFPSGHVARTTMIVIVLASWLGASQWSRAAKSMALASLLLLEATMLVSRAYLGEHWASDVIGGALLASACALVALRYPINLPTHFIRKFF